MLKLKQNPEKILNRIDWTVIRRLDGLLQGDYRTLFHGFGLDLAELREYQFSDDVRYIDWNVTARLQTPYVRQYLEDREVTAWFLLDLSPSVDFGTVNVHKRDLLVDFVTLLARLLTRHGNRIGAIFYNGQVGKFIVPQSGRLHVLRLLNDLLMQPQLKRAAPTNLATLFGAAASIIRRRSLLFVISDFLSVPGWEKTLSILTTRQEVLAVRLYDPREVDFPDVGPLFLEDAETGEQLYVDTHDRKFRERFNRAAQERELKLNSAFSRVGVDVLTLSTEGDMVAEIMRFAARRKRRQKSPASFARAGATSIFPKPKA